MRVLHFNSTLSSNSGVISVLMNYFRNIDRTKVQFDFMYFYESEVSCQCEIEELGGKCFLIASPMYYLQFRKDLKHFFDQYAEKYDILHIHDWVFATMVYSVAKHYKNLKIIVHSHATNYSDKKLSALRNRILCHNLNKCCDERFACSRAAGDFLFRQYPYYIMSNAIDIQKYTFDAEVRKEYRRDLGIEDMFVVGHVGAFVHQKNHKFLLEIFKNILTKMDNSVLMLVGDGVLKTETMKKVSELGMEEQVKFLGRRQDVDKLYQCMDILVMPSLFEGLPMAGIEAQCSGLPVIFSDHVSKEAGIGHSCHLRLSDSPEIWAEEIVKLSKERHLEERKSGRTVVESSGYSIKVEAIRLMEKYELMEKG